MTASMPSALARDWHWRFVARYAGVVSGPFFSAAMNSSWPKYGISRAFSRSLNAITSLSDRTLTVGGVAARYALRPALNSYTNMSIKQV